MGSPAKPCVPKGNRLQASKKPTGRRPGFNGETPSCVGLRPTCMVFPIEIGSPTRCASSTLIARQVLSGSRC